MTEKPPDKLPQTEQVTEATANNTVESAVPDHAKLVESLLSQLEVFFSGKLAEMFVAVEEHIFHSADQAKKHR